MKAILTALIMIGFLGSMASAREEGTRVGAVTKKHGQKSKKRGPASTKKKKKKKKKKSKKHQY